MKILLTTIFFLFSQVAIASHDDVHTRTLAREEIIKDKIYAHVSADGVVNTARSRRILQNNVAVIAEGQYCFNNILATIHGGQVTVDPTISKVAHPTSLSLDHPGCQALVVIGCKAAQPCPTASAFYVMFYKK